MKQLQMIVIPCDSSNSGEIDFKITLATFIAINLICLGVFLYGTFRYYTDKGQKERCTFVEYMSIFGLEAPDILSISNILWILLNCVAVFFGFIYLIASIL